jgi:hypothetical protein
MKQQLFKKKHQNVEVPDITPRSQDPSEGDDLQACIAQRAYELYEQEGCCHGQDFAHWLQAEREILEVEPKK